MYDFNTNKQTVHHTSNIFEERGVRIIHKQSSYSSRYYLEVKLGMLDDNKCPLGWQFVSCTEEVQKDWKKFALRILKALYKRRERRVEALHQEAKDVEREAQFYKNIKERLQKEEENND